MEEKSFNTERHWSDSDNDNTTDNTIPTTAIKSSQRTAFGCRRTQRYRQCPGWPECHHRPHNDAGPPRRELYPRFQICSILFYRCCSSSNLHLWMGNDKRARGGGGGVGSMFPQFYSPKTLCSHEQGDSRAVGQ